MAFLLSPKSGGGVTYALIAANDVRINDGEIQYPTEDDPGTVRPGDVLTWQDTAQNSVAYFRVWGDEESVITQGPASSPYTVQAVDGAVWLSLFRLG
jgi:hypothetical protein